MRRNLLMIAGAIPWIFARGTKQFRFAHFRDLCFRIAVTILLLLSRSVRAENGGLEIDAWIEPHEHIAVGQQVTLTIQIATARWFAGGATIPRLEINDAIVLARDKFATNLSIDRSDGSWSAQQYTLRIYPQKSGSYRVPSLRVRAIVAGEDGMPETRELDTLPVTFAARIPEPMRDKQSWIAAPEFSVSERFDHSFDSLKPGDALRRVIVFEATDIPAMFLPGADASAAEGLAVYPKSPQLEDRVNRGSYSARRTEVNDYLIEQVGEYRLPAQTFHWWNTSTARAERIELPERVIRVGSGAGVLLQSSGAASAKGGARWRVVIGGLISVLIGAVALWLVLRRTRSNGDANPGGFASKRTLHRTYRQAIQRGDYVAAVTILYHWHDLHAVDFNGALSEYLERTRSSATAEELTLLLQAVYAAEQPDKASAQLHRQWRRLLPCTRAWLWRDPSRHFCSRRARRDPRWIEPMA